MFACFMGVMDQLVSLNFYYLTCSYLTSLSFSPSRRIRTLNPFTQHGRPCRTPLPFVILNVILVHNPSCSFLSPFFLSHRTEHQNKNMQPVPSLPRFRLLDQPYIKMRAFSFSFFTFLPSTHPQTHPPTHTHTQTHAWKP